MARDTLKGPEEAPDRSAESTAAPGIAPGKVTRTGKLPGQGRAVQRRALPSTGHAAPPPRSTREAAADSWMDAAHRGAAFSPASQDPVQARGQPTGQDSAADPASVHRAAADGISGSGAGLPYADRIQESFGPAHDVGGVRAHVGGAAAQASEHMGAEAYATGEDIAFRGQPDLHTVAHEAAHVVQQRAGVQLDSGVGRAGDSYERHADQVADAVVAGRSAEGLLGQMTGQSGAGSERAIQRFESREHKHLGDEGTRTEQGQTRMVELAPNYLVSFGDLTAMCGDYFESVTQIRALAARDGQGGGSREEIEYVRAVHVLGNTAAETRYSQGARDAVMARYYRLAGNNSSHFTEPNGRTERSSLNNAGNYRDNHENAISTAVSAGAAGQSIDGALLCEGFASHFLTDAYAAGHVRTERISISAWWNPKVPMFWTNLKLFIAEEMAKYINDNSTLAGILTVQQLWGKVRASIEAKNLPTLTFGDLVSGAVHDYDNENGVATQHGSLVGDAQLRDAQGREVLDPGTNRRVDGALETENLAIAAVRTSMADVERAFALGRTQPVAAVRTSLQADGQYAAERLWPRASPESQQPAPRPPWQQPDVGALLAEPTMQKALRIFAEEKAESLNAALTFEDQTGVSAAMQATAFRTRITGPLAATPLPMLRRLIDYTPNTGGGVGGHDTDDNAMEYTGMARSAGAMATLTQPQRTRLIRDMISGICGDEEEQAIIELLRSCSPGMMTAIVTDLGGGNAAEGIEYLDSGVDGAEWRTLEGVLRRSPTLARHL
jgi:hypothetical protein